MFVITLMTWIVLAGIVVATHKLSNNNEDVTVIVGLIALGLGIVVPIILNFWRPVFFGWAGKRKRLQAKLMADGVLTNADLEKGARLVQIVEVKPGTNRRVTDSRQLAFMMLDQKVCRVFGEKTCFSAETFKAVPGVTGQCSKCWVIWACGGDSFRLQAAVGGANREFLVQCREGRTLRQVAKSTEMLEELVEIDSAPAGAKPAATPPTDACGTGGGCGCCGGGEENPGGCGQDTGNA